MGNRLYLAAYGLCFGIPLGEVERLASAGMSLLLWLLGSLVAISLIADSPYAALVVTALAGVAFGLNIFLDDGAVPARASPPDHQDNLRRVLAQYGWLMDVAATLLLIFPTRWMFAGFVLVLLSWLRRWWVRGRIVHRTLFDLAIFALLLMVPVSMWASADLSVSIIPLGQVVAGVNVFYAIAERVETKEDIYLAAAGLVGLGVVIAAVAPFGVDWIKTKFLALPQVYGRFLQILPNAIHPNLLAGALALILPLAVAGLLFAPLHPLSPRGRRIARIFLAVGLAIISVFLVLSQSRGGLVATVMGLLLLLAFKGRVALGAGVAASAGVAAYVLSRIDAQKLADLFFSTDTINGLAGREEIWSRAIYAMQDVPYTGIGLGMFSRAVKVLYPLFLAGPDVDVGYAHNVYLQVGVDLGIPGLVAYMAILTLGLVIAWQSFLSARQRQEGDMAAVALGLAVGLVVVMLHGLVDSAIWDTKPAILSWALFGMIAAVDRQRRPVLADTGEWVGVGAAPSVSVRSSNRKATAYERAWFEGAAPQRRALDHILYDPPAFDQVVKLGLHFLGLAEGDQVLDLGCGEGKETVQMVQLGAHVVALDISYQQLMKAQHQLDGHRGEGRVSLIQANAEQLPFAPNSFRRIYGKAILHHLDLPAAADEIGRVLDKRGRACFAEPLAHHPLFWVARRLTPNLHSANESPLTLSQLDWLRRLFGQCQVVSHFLISPLAYPLRLLPGGEGRFRQTHASLAKLDERLFAAFPRLRRWSWYGLVNIYRDDQTAAQTVPDSQ